MARSRNIKPSFFDHDGLADNSPIGRLLFIGMWTIADYKGELEWRPKRVKAQLLPYDDCDIEELAINLEKSGFIRFYYVQGIKYVHVVNFNKHQNPHKNERDKGSDIPSIEQCDSDDVSQVIENKEVEINRDNIEINREENGSAPADSLFPLPDSLFPLPDSLLLIPEGKEGRKKRDSDEKSNSPEFIPPEGLNMAAWEEWVSYRKASKLRSYQNNPKSAGSVMTKLVNLSGGDKELQAQIVQQSIENAYQGLFPLKTGQKSHKVNRHKLDDIIHTSGSF
ncbi:MAG: hypothetical protein ACRC8W_04760 [Plesiomonas shigelloides]